MTMTPTEFHDLMTQALAGGPSSDLAAVERDIATGRRLLSRRRRTAGALVLACVVALGLAIVAGTGDGGRPDAIDQSNQLSEKKMIRMCRAASRPAGVTAVFGPGTPRVMAIARQSEASAIALESADGVSWATCSIDITDGRPRTSTTAYASKSNPGEPRAPELHMEFSCRAEDPSCLAFRVYGADRLPPVVATVEIRTPDGATTRVPTDRGFFAFTYSGEVTSRDQLDAKYGPVAALTPGYVYLDRTNTPIAGIRANLRHPSHPLKVGNLPLVYDFSAVRGAPID